MSETGATPRALWALVPLALFLGLGLLFWKGLSGDPHTLPSTLINRPVPAFDLPAVEGLGLPGLRDADLRPGGPAAGKVTVVNIWASWCGPCREEHPLLLELSRRSDIRLVGINNKDEPANAVRFLSALGQPFSQVGADRNGRVSIDWGGYGVPESFIVDAQGVIRHKHVGPLTPELLAGEFGAAIAAAKTPIPVQ